MLTKDPNFKAPEGEEDLWLSREDVAEICPPCAEKMVAMGVLRVRANVLYNERLQQAVLFGNPEPCEGCP